MSDESDTNDGNVHAETVKSEVQEALIKLEKLCAGEAKCSVSQNLDAIQIEKTESLKTEQDTCTNTIPEIEVDEMTKVEEIEIAPSSPVSPSVTVLPNEDNAEKNANFDLVFPYGHEFMIEGERPLAVLIAKENGDSDRTRQYENYDEWFSRISKEHSSESVWINVRKRELRGGKPVSPSLTTTSSVQPSCLNNIKMEHVDINENNIPNTSRDITRSPKSQPRLMVKNPEQINKPILDKIMRNDGIVCGTYVAIDNCNVDHTNTLPATCSYQTNVTRSHQSRQKLMVKKPNQINDKTTEKRMPTDHNYCSNSNKIRGKKMDQVCVSDLPSKLQHNHESRSPRVAVKKFNQINEPTLDKRMQIDHDYCQNADNIKDCNVSHISISSVPPSCQCYKIVDQVCTCNDIPVTLQNDVVTDMMRSHESRPRQTVKRPDKINEPIPNKRMRTDKNNINISPTPHSSQSNKKTEQICISHNAIPLVENSDTINDCNVDNTSIAHLSQTNKKQDKECVRDKDIAVTLQHIASSIERRHESRPRLVEKRSNVNILKKKKQVDNYCDVDKINKDSSVDSINGEDALSDKEHFEWVSIDSFHGIRESFMITQTGSVTSHDTIYDAFRAIWDDYILKTIALETNRYANSPLSSDEFKKQWYDTNAHEILVLFTFWIMLGVIRMPTIKSCFSNDPLLKVNVFKTMFTKNRYDSLVSALRFANDNIKSSKASELHCINVILDHLNKKFQSNFVPDQNISVDESFLPWKGSLSFQQVHTSINTENSGIKTLELCDSATGYLWSLLIYSGDEKESVESQTKSTVQKYNATVLKLIRPLLNKGYTVYMNVSLISPTLARFLKKNKTDCVAMIDPSLEGVQHIVELANMKPGHVLAQHAIDVCIMAWYSKKKNIYISTYHGTELKEPPHEKHHPKGWKPQVVVDCDKNLGVVGRKNVMLEPYVSEKRNRCDRWHIKLLKRMLNSSILNAQILLESSKKMKVDHLAARLQLVDIILGRHLCLCPVTKWDSRQTLKLPPWRDSGGGHWPALCEPAGATTNQSSSKNASTGGRGHLVEGDGASASAGATTSGHGGSKSFKNASSRARKRGRGRGQQRVQSEPSTSDDDASTSYKLSASDDDISASDDDISTTDDDDNTNDVDTNTNDADANTNDADANTNDADANTCATTSVRASDIESENSLLEVRFRRRVVSKRTAGAPAPARTQPATKKRAAPARKRRALKNSLLEVRSRRRVVSKRTAGAPAPARTQPATKKRAAPARKRRALNASPERDPIVLTSPCAKASKQIVLVPSSSCEPTEELVMDYELASGETELRLVGSSLQSQTKTTCSDSAPDPSETVLTVELDKFTFDSEEDDDFDDNNDHIADAVFIPAPTYRTATDNPTDNAGLSLAQLTTLEAAEAADDRFVRDLAPSADCFQFQWSCNRQTFTGTREVFTGSPGPTFPVTDEMTIVEVFEKMIDADFLDLMVTETNRYADQTVERLKLDPSTKKRTRALQWTPTDRAEMVTYLAVIILQGLYPKVKEESYFGFDGYGTTPYFSRIMNYGRYHMLKMFHHFVDNTSTTDRTKLSKIKPMIDYFNKKFGSLYSPKQEIAIDESLLKCHGRLSFSQKIATKAAQVGIKIYELCESGSGYLWTFSVYTGKDEPNRTKQTGPNQDGQDKDRQDGDIQDNNDQLDERRTDKDTTRPSRPDLNDGEQQNEDQDDSGLDEREMGRPEDRPDVGHERDFRSSDATAKIVSDATAKIVYDLVEPLLHRGHTLVMDNFYNSPLLARCLKKTKTDVYGTLRLTREFVPDTLKTMTKTDMRLGEVVASYCSDLAVMLWRDSSLVSMISTYHPLQGKTGDKYNRVVYKPSIVLDYNTSMGGVNRKDQCLAGQPLERQKNRVWYKKLFRRLFNAALFNCFVIYTSNPTHKLGHREFRVRLAETLLRNYRQIDLTTEPRLTRPKSTATDGTLLVRKTARPYVEGNHFPAKTGSKNTRCWMCSRNKRTTRTTFKCEECNINLCLVDCFKAYHKPPRSGRSPS